MHALGLGSIASAWARRHHQDRRERSGARSSRSSSGTWPDRRGDDAAISGPFREYVV